MEKFLPIIKTSPLFHGMGDNEILMMLNCLSSKVETFDKGDYIFYVGDSINSMGMVLTGTIHIVEEDYLGNRNLLGSVTNSQLFGEDYACDPTMKLSVSIYAAEKTQVLTMNVQKVTTVCTTACKFHTRLIQNLLAVLAKKVEELTKKIKHNSKRTTREKLLSYLSEQAEIAKNNRFSIPFNRQELADYLSVDRSAMSNELCKMRDEGIIEFNKNKFNLVIYTNR